MVHNNLSLHICSNYWSGQDVAELICYLQGVNHIHLCRVDLDQISAAGFDANVY